MGIVVVVFVFSQRKSTLKKSFLRNHAVVSICSVSCVGRWVGGVYSDDGSLIFQSSSSRPELHMEKWAFFSLAFFFRLFFSQLQQQNLL